MTRLPLSWRRGVSACCFLALALSFVVWAGCSSSDDGDDRPRPGGEDGGPAGKGGAGGRGGGAGGREGGAGGSGGESVDGGAEPLPPPGSAFPTLPARTTIVISEIMYHPVKEETDEDLHEFVELFNRSAAPVDLAGWTLGSSGAGGVRFTFPAGARIAPGEYKVVAKSRSRLAAVEQYHLVEGALWGDYAGALDNGGAKVSLQDRAGAVVDAVDYRDGAPWPTAADALGVGEDWLPQADRPITKHQHRGRSLERIDLDRISNDPANWEASPLAGPTPGRESAVKGTVLPIVEEITARPVGRPKDEVIRAEDRVVVRARISRYGEATGLELSYFEDDLTKPNAAEARATVPMTFLPEERVWQAELPPRAENALVRFVVRGTREGVTGPISPRPTDPLEGHAYFVTPEIDSTSRAYHLLIAPSEWSKLETWLAARRAPSAPQGQAVCTWSPDWDTEVPATFVFDGHVYDVRVRYSGSRYQRPNGYNLPATWNRAALVPAGRALRALSWKIKFPKYDAFEGYPSINLNKMFQGCPGTVSYVEGKLLEKAGLPSYKVRFARLHVNGAYYHYMMEPEPIGEEMLSRYLGPGETVGDLFKSDGAGNDEAAATRGDFKPIAAPPGYCGGKFTPLDRYEATYTRETHEHRSHEPLVKLIDDLDRAVKSGTASPLVKDYFTANWDVTALARSFAVRNWSGVWDDTFHNFFPYQQPSGKWLLIQQDFEWDFGLGRFGGETTLAPWRPDVTLYLGAYPANAAIANGCELPAGTPRIPGQGNCNALGFSRLKDAFIQNFRQEFDDALRALSQDVLAAEAVVKVIDEAAAVFNQDDWKKSPAPKGYCDPSKMNEAMREWARARAEVVKARLRP